MSMEVESGSLYSGMKNILVMRTRHVSLDQQFCSLWLAGNMCGVPTNGHKGKDWKVDAKHFADDVLRASGLPDAQRHLNP